MWFLIIELWTLAGGLIVLFLGGACHVSLIEDADGWEFVNPKIIYERMHVNWFGAVVVSVFFNALCPIGAICYWLYKLCTIGRK